MQDCGLEMQNKIQMEGMEICQVFFRDGVCGKTILSKWKWIWRHWDEYLRECFAKLDKYNHLA